MKFLLQGHVGASAAAPSESACCAFCFGEHSIYLQIKVCDYVFHIVWLVVFVIFSYTAIVLIHADRTQIFETVTFEE
jgi:hypothetical protein